MMGRLNQDQGRLFYSFCLDDVVPGDHRVREIGAVLDLSWVHAELKPYYSRMGRPSIDPVLMIRMLIIGYVFAVRSERALCREVQVNLAYRWFCGLSIEDKIPDHSAFSRARNERFRDSDIFRRVFERVVEACLASGLVGGEGFAVDASLIRADVHRQRSVPGDEGLPPEVVGRAVREYLDVLDDAAFGGATPVLPKRIALTDPASRWTAATRERAFYAYSTNYLIDLEHAVIVDVEATTSVRQAEVTAQRRMIDRAQARFDLRPERLVADASYGDAANLAWLVEDKGIAPHIPVFDKSARTDGTFERSAFTFDQKDDSYICPGGKRLRPRNRNFTVPRSNVDQDGFIRYRARQQDCGDCALRQRCTPNMPARKIMRSIHEGARDIARDIAMTDAYVTSRRQRKKVEMLFAHLKRILKLDRLRLRGPNGAKDEFLLAATAQNLRKMAKLITILPLPAPV